MQWANNNISKLIAQQFYEEAAYILKVALAIDMHNPRTLELQNMIDEIQLNNDKLVVNKNFQRLKR